MTDDREKLIEEMARAIWPVPNENTRITARRALSVAETALAEKHARICEAQYPVPALKLAAAIRASVEKKDAN